MLKLTMGVKSVWEVVKTAVVAWSADNAARLGAALSYYTVFAISPLFLIVIFVASLWFSQEAVRAELFGQLADLVGKRGAATIESALAASAPHSQGVVASVLAIGTLVITATGLFVELQNALNAVFNVKSKGSLGVWGFFKNRLLSFAMVVGIGFLLLVTLVVSALLSAFGKYISALAPGLDVFWMIVNTVISLGVITLLFAMIFKILPDVQIAWRDVWVGAGITAVLFTAGKFLLGLYLGQNATVSAYGAAGSVILILLWVYYSAQILFFGAEVTQVYANRFGARLRPKAHAEWITPPPEKPREKSQAAPLPDRRQELINDLRREVDSLRAFVRREEAKKSG